MARSIADIADVYGGLFTPGGGGFATNMPATGVAPYGQDLYSRNLLQPETDLSQVRSIFDAWGNRFNQSLAGPLADLTTGLGTLSGRFKSLDEWMREYVARQNAPAASGVQPGTEETGAPGPTGGTSPVVTDAPTGLGTGPVAMLGPNLVTGGNLLTNLGQLVANVSLPGSVAPDTVLGAGGTDQGAGVLPRAVGAGFVDLGNGTGYDTAGRWYRFGPGGWDEDPAGSIDTTFGTGAPDPMMGTGGPDARVNWQPGDIATVRATGQAVVYGSDGLWYPAEDRLFGGGVSPVGGGGGDVVAADTVPGGVTADTVPGGVTIDPMTGQTVATIGQGLNAAGHLTNLVGGIQEEDPARITAALLGLGGNPAVLGALGVPNVVPGTGDILPPTTVLNPATGEMVDVPSEGIPVTTAATIASGFLTMGASLARDAPDEQRALGAAQGSAQVVGGVAQLMGLNGVARAMPYVQAAIGIAANAFTDKPADQQAIEAALDVAGAALAGSTFGLSLFAAQFLKAVISPLFPADVPHRVREALEVSDVGRVVLTAISAIGQAETAEDLHRLAQQGTFGADEGRPVAIPMSFGTDAQATLDLLLEAPSANVQAGVLDQFKDPMNAAVAGALRRQATLIRAAEAFSANAPTPGRQYLASDVDYFIRNAERFDGAPYDALNAAQVERVVGQHLMETYRRPGGGWYGPWLDPGLIYNQQGLDEPLRRRGVSEDDIEAARQLFAAKAPLLTGVQGSQDPAQAMADVTGLPASTTRYYVGPAAAFTPVEAVAPEPELRGLAEPSDSVAMTPEQVALATMAGQFTD